MNTTLKKRQAFLERANKLYDNYYDYSQMEYVNQNTKITIICPKHGPFERTPKYHQQGGGCPVCAQIRVANYWTPERRKAKSEEVLTTGLKKRKETNRKRYGADSWAESDASKKLRKEHKGPWSQESYDKIRQTNLERYGSTTWAGSEDGRRALHEMNSTPEMRKKISDGVRSEAARRKYQETCLKNYGTTHWAKSDVGKSKLLDINRTYKKSKSENKLYELLCQYFDKADVQRQYGSDDRYPFNCDFYIESLDLFIELNAYWMHGNEWFDRNRSYHLERIENWRSIAKPMYQRAIDTWTDRDVLKRQTAKENDLNYVVFWDNDLSDAKEWIVQGCPIRKDWK